MSRVQVYVFNYVGYDVRNSKIDAFYTELKCEFSFIDLMVRRPVLEMIDSSNDEMNQIPIAEEQPK